MSDFQGYVPYRVAKKITKSPIKSVIAGILFFVFLAIVFACLVYFRKVEKCYERQCVYAVFVSKNKRKIDDASVELIKSLGGAASILFFRQEYYLIANVYLKEEDADEIATSLKKTFNDAGVVKLEHKTLPRKTVLHISQNLSYARFFEKFYAFMYDFEEMQMNYLLGSLSEGDFLTKLYKFKLDIKETIDNFENPDNEKFFDDISTYASMCVNYLESFYTEFFQSTRKEMLIAKLKFEIYKLKVDLFENLQ